jgi:hypothetical protein
MVGGHRYIEDKHPGMWSPPPGGLVQHTDLGTREGEKSKKLKKLGTRAGTWVSRSPWT